MNRVNEAAVAVMQRFRQKTKLRVGKRASGKGSHIKDINFLWQAKRFHIGIHPETYNAATSLELKCTAERVKMIPCLQYHSEAKNSEQGAAEHSKADASILDPSRCLSTLNNYLAHDDLRLSFEMIFMLFYFFIKNVLRSGRDMGQSVRRNKKQNF